MENERRRTPRIMFSIPLTLHGTDQKGVPFETIGRTITLNRHGARIQVSGPLTPAQTIRVINDANGQEAEFRVVGPTAPPFEQVGEWGVECLHMDKNIWDIEFPPSDEDSDAHVLLACRQCEVSALQSLSLVEVEVLGTAGVLTKPCLRCGDSTPWGYPKMAFHLESRTYQTAVREATGQFPTQAALAAERRKSLRTPAQLPVRVRDYYGEVDIAQTENISLEGLCFSSPRKYWVGQGVVVTCPFGTPEEKPEVRGRIVRADSGPERGKFNYGVKYE
jgi:hypothetical protein